ncbi:MAG TPA: sigma-70 family RNA polymerase sigma factor [Polyangiaceae bacterium]|nr:sigma-70 family RNA polymerase sigma factor [Polyangiaceae bacterium]
MDQLGAVVSLQAGLGASPVLELDAIYREHSAAVSKWVRRMWGPGGVSGSVDAEDLLQEVFLVVQRRLGTFRSEAALTTWLYGITVFVVSGRRKKERWRRLLWRRAEPELQLDHDQALPAVQQDFERAEASRLVYSVLNQLSERDRTLLILFELERLPGVEVAAILGISEPNVWVGLTRARTRFKKVFEQRYPDFEIAEGANHVGG